MKNNLFFSLLIIVLSFSTKLKAENVLYCESELATGFIFDEGKWKETSFKRERFTVRFNENFTKLEGFYGPMTCFAPFNHKPNFISCIETDFPYQPFLYHKQKKQFKFAQFSSAGYLSDAEDGNDFDTDVMYLGTCTNF